MKNLIYLVLAIVALLFAQACQNEHGKNYNDATRVDGDGLAFIKNGIEGGLTEIKASGLAITNSRNLRVIKFAKMMIDDHTKADSGLKNIEKDKIVHGKDLISSTHEAMIGSLAKKTGAGFDKAYLQMMVTDHEAALQVFGKGKGNTDNVISSFAAGTLATIKMHLDSAKSVLASLK